MLFQGKLVSLLKNTFNHFRKKKNSRYSQREIRYLSADLTVKKMHQLFQEKHPEVKVNYWFYYKIFKEMFNLRFGRPQVDTCVTCESLNTKIKSPALNEVARRSAVAELIVHKRKSKKFTINLKKFETSVNLMILLLDSILTL